MAALELRALHPEDVSMDQTVTGSKDGKKAWKALLWVWLLLGALSVVLGLFQGFDADDWRRIGLIAASMCMAKSQMHEKRSTLWLVLALIGLAVITVERIVTWAT